jgi:bacteriocin biosynthesis cyclodehydratase domain-containing protein
MSTGATTTQLVGFKRHLRAEVRTGAGAYLFSEHGVTVLKGAHIEALAKLLDGTRDLATLLGAVPAGMAPEQVLALISRLAEAGLVTARSPQTSTIDDSTVAYWEAAGIDAAAAVAGFTAKTVRLVTVGEVDTLGALGALRSAGLSVTSGADLTVAGADLSVVLCDDYLNPRLAQVDATHRAAGKPWLLAKPSGSKVWCGPIFDGTEPGCWHCLAVRLWGHRNAEACAQSVLGHEGPAPRPAAGIRPLAATALQLITLEATKWLAGYRYSGQRAVWTFDSLDLRGVHHEMRVRPQCRACGNPNLMREQAHRPVVLSSRQKVSRSGGGHRSEGPEQVKERYWHLVSPVTGIVKEIRRDDRVPAFFNSFRSGPNVAAQVRDLESLRTAVRMDNGGKGITPLHAEVSALCEAIERYSGTFHGDEERIRGSLNSLGEQAIHPNTCQLYSERQYEQRDEWNASNALFQYVCEKFDEDAVMDWTPVWSLTQRRQRYLPTAMLFYGAPGVPGHSYVAADSNGNAAGSSKEDAVLQGLLELVERDAVALWWYNRSRLPGVDLDAFGDPWIDELRDVYAGLGREVWVLDATSDLDIPVMIALSRRTDRSTEDIMIGLGAHLDPRVALLRALTELNQLMPAVVEATGDGRYDRDDPDLVQWWCDATVANQPYLAADPAEEPRRPGDYNWAPCRDLLTDIVAIQSKLEKLGMEVLVLDQTRPDIGLPVVKVLVPGLRHFWARLAPGRLYDVPVRLGRQAEPSSFDELNPIPMFL